MWAPDLEENPDLEPNLIEGNDVTPAHQDVVETSLRLIAAVLLAGTRFDELNLSRGSFRITGLARVTLFLGVLAAAHNIRLYRNWHEKHQLGDPTDPLLTPDSQTIVRHLTSQEYSAYERVTGIGPALSAWEADVLPLNYTRAWPEGQAQTLYQASRPALHSLLMTPATSSYSTPALRLPRRSEGRPSRWSSRRQLGTVTP